MTTLASKYASKQVSKLKKGHRPQAMRFNDELSKGNQLPHSTP